MLTGPERSGNGRSRLQFDTMTLAVVDRQTITCETALPRNRQRGGRIKPSGQENDSPLLTR